MAEELQVVKFVREQVPDWDDDVKTTARYKAFSGQRSDWEPQFHFWRDLIIKIARRFNLLFLSPSQMTNCWFNKGGLSPLCLNDVLGVKVSLSSATVSNIPSIDSVILQLVWTLEELQQQLVVIDEQHLRSRKLGLAALRSGDKKLALRNARQLKLASESREKVTSFFNRVEEVLRVITEAESAKKVSEAIQLGARAIKENQVEVKEVQLCLQELDELMESQEIIHNALESASYTSLEDDDVEEELRKLESQIRDEIVVVLTPKSEEDAKALVDPDSLCAAIVDLKLENNNVDSGTSRNYMNRKLEAA